MDPLHPSDPEHIGRYRLTHRLGAGGMGRVYLARTASGRRVVVKVILTEYADDAEFRARFVREAEAARRVGGFHTAQVVDADPGADPPWIATTYIPGPSLHEALRDHGPMAPDALRGLAVGLTEGLEAVHRAGLVHRDLKPGNIILAEDGPRIIDFGIARPTDSTHMTATGAVLGTLPYMSPEQTEGHRVGPASDVFSLGTVLAFAATGTNPFAADTMAATVRRLIGPRPDPGDVAPDLRAVILDCWQQDPAARPTPERILGRLGTDVPAMLPPTRVLAPEPAAVAVRAPEEPQAPEPRPAGSPAHADPRWGMASWEIWALLAVVVGAALLILRPALAPGSAGGQPVEGHEGAVTAVAFSPDGSVVATGGADGTTRLWGFGTARPEQVLDVRTDLVTSLAFSADGTTLAVVDNTTVHLVDVADGEPVAELTDVPEPLAAAFNPDGTSLAVVGATDTAWLLDARTGETGTRLTGQENGAFAVAFDRQGSLLATAGYDGTVQVWNAATGEPVTILTGHEGIVYAAAFSPDGSEVATAGYDGTVRLWSAMGGEGEILGEHRGGATSVAFSPDGGAVVSTGGDGAVRRWSTADGTVSDILVGDVHGASAVSPDGSTIAYGDPEGSLQWYPLN